MVPSGWKVKSPSKLFKLFSGFAFKSSDAQESGAKWLKIANVGIGEIKWDADSFLPENFLIEHKKYLLTKGDIVVALTRPTIGNKLKVARLNRDSDTSLLNQRVAKIVCEENVDSEFIFQVLRSDQFAFRINVGLLGTDPPNLSVKVLEDFTIHVPPLPEQRKIAAILSTWDKAITTTEQLLANSQQQKKALMQQLLTGKKRLLDENGERFRGEWKEVAVSSFGKVVTGSTPPKDNDSNYGGDISWATAEDFKCKYVANTKVKLTKSGASKARVVPKGSVLVTCIASIGKNAIANEILATNQQINAVVINSHHSNEFFYYLVEFNTHRLLALAGTTAVPILNKTSFEKIRFKTPCKEEQQKIASVLTAADNEISALQQKIEALKQEKKALMQQLLTGKRRVEVDEVAA
ncbi:restriction endonuclease subunit S [Escherichia coli]|uniref:restriction endonuclease subunit S n=1 Tax=Klebsiella pneumoniae TaxID=573 RepID=UPI002B3B61F9|nr:restriction endonuclease subunit S [Escherichia coli]